MRAHAILFMRRYGVPPQTTEGDEVKALEIYVAKVLQDVQKFEADRARRKWRGKLTDRMGVNRTVSQAVRRSADVTIRTMRASRGEQPVLTQQQVFDLLDGFWGGIRQRPAGELSTWAQQFLDPIPQSPELQLPQLEPRMIKERFMQMKLHTSKGPDAW